jgi:hypothetical protein
MRLPFFNPFQSQLARVAFSPGHYWVVSSRHLLSRILRYTLLDSSPHSSEILLSMSKPDIGGAAHAM